MMRFGRRSAWTAAIAVVVAAACESSGGDPGSDAGDGGSEEAPPVLVGFGEPCGGDSECVSGACYEGACTRPCGMLADCPEPGYTCGAADEGRVLCVTTRYRTGSGTAGEQCVTAICDEAGGFRCISRGDSDPYAYCTGSCADDRDCPAGMVCRDSAEGRLCRPRGYCEPCMFDDQCGWGNDDCLRDDAGEGFCSVQCDPERPTTCPQDSECIEAAPGRFQCRPAFGRCVGDGDYCHPCRDEADCAADSDCITDAYTKFSFCGQPCAVQEDCPVEHYCHTGLGQCRPRKGSCETPSGGRRTCQACSDFTDCYSGWCIDFVEPRDGSPETCGDSCNPGDAQPCGPWGQCYRLTDETGATVGHACFPPATMPCWQYRLCVQDCPDGPSGCPHTYCRA